jgi:hypothetical protein
VEKLKSGLSLGFRFKEGGGERKWSLVKLSGEKK